MRKPSGIISTAASVATLLGSLTLAPIAGAAEDAKAMSAVDEGKEIAFDNKKGNCLACHQIAGGQLAGDIGPPLVAMQARYPDKAKLRAQIWDASKANPSTIMPPFGRHMILTEGEIDKVVEFIHTL